MDASRFISSLRHDKDYAGQIVHVEELPRREAVFKDLSRPLDERVARVLRERGVQRLYSHQADAIEAVRAGRNVVVVTSTASGKTLCYHVPVLEAWLLDRETRALYLYPTKALAQDQLRGLVRFQELEPAFSFQAGTYDGDTPTATRKRLRDQGHLILSNPDMLHSGILPNHARWAEFFSNLKFVIIDEIHTYRGIFGSNVANVLRRLNRVCEHYGSRPQFICASATIANPGALAERLTGQPMSVVDRDGSPKGPKQIVFWNPPYTDAGHTERRSHNSEARALMVKLISERLPTITFVQTRVVAELLLRYCQEDLQRISPRLANAIKAYRSGYLPEERREIERRLFSGELLGVTSTNALELGIDVGSLDAAIVVGYPGTIASTWQQMGRAGRTTEESLAILIGRNNPIDQYLLNNTGYFFGRSFEEAIIDPENPFILVSHLRCAANELPVDRADEERFGKDAPSIMLVLEEAEEVTLVGDKWFWAGKGYPAADFGLRNMAENTYTIVDTTGPKNQVVGTVDEFGAFMLVHPQAIYLHEAETYFVKKLDLTQRIAYIEKVDSDYYTQAVTEEKIRITETETEKMWRVSKACFGDVTVTTAVIMFKKIKFYSSDSLGFGSLDLPLLELETTGLWLTPSAEVLKRVRELGRIPAEGMMGIANVLPHVIPLFIICDFMDIGTVLDSSNTGSPTVFVYDKYPGGLMFAEKAYEKLEEIMQACLRLISACGCDYGCPSCVGSPTRAWTVQAGALESVERIPDKEAALIILHAMLEIEPYVPRLPPLDVTGPASAQRRAEIAPLPANVECKVRKRIDALRKRRRPAGGDEAQGGGF